MRKTTFFTVVLITSILLTACKPLSEPVSDEPTLSATPTLTSEPPTATLAADTPTAAPTGTNIPSATPLPPTSTPTQPPTRTPMPTATPFPCNQGSFVGDVTVPDGTLFSAGTTFEKIWRLQNTGQCSWTPAYALVAVGGDLLGGPTVVPLTHNVNPGETIDLSVTLTAPSTPGNYQGSWMLRSADGVLFGLGSTADKPFWARIEVGNPTPAPFAVTHVTVSADPISFTGKCPATFNLIAQIWTNGAGKVTYYWLRSDGSQSEPATINFSNGGIQVVSTPWTFGIPGAGYNRWARVYIDQPNHQFFDQVNIVLSCANQEPS